MKTQSAVLSAALLLLAPVSAEPSYARIGSDGMTVVDSGSWYLEEYDSLGRPIRATQWTDAEISSVTTWLYDGDSPRCITRVMTYESGSIETGFDAMGNEIYVEEKDAAGTLVSATAREWDTARNELLRTTMAGGSTETLRWVYGEDGTLTERKFEKNGVVVLRAVYASDEDWTETLYRNGSPVLVQRYVNGVREAAR